MKHETLAVYYAVQDPEVGWLPKILATIAVAYVVSPLDLIPDFIPILGLLDDLIILPALLWLAIYLIPEDVMERARNKATTQPMRLSHNWVAALIFFIVWNAFFASLAWILLHRFGNEKVKDMQCWIIGGTVAFATLCEGIWAALQIKSEQNRAAEGSSSSSRSSSSDEDNAALEEPLLQES